MTREQIEAIIAGLDRMANGQPYLGAKNSLMSLLTEKEQPRFLDPDKIRELCRMALAGLDAPNAYRAGQEAMRERAAKTAGDAYPMPLDGGSANEYEFDTAKRAEERIRPLPIEGEKP